MTILDQSLTPLSFVGGPAILANTCAVLQNGVNMRYSHAVDQWRRFQASSVDHDGRLAVLYSDPSAALRLSGQRLRLQLRELELLVVGSSAFGVTSFLALIWSLLLMTGSPAANLSAALMLASGSIGLLVLLTVAVELLRESRCARALMRLHLQPGLDALA
jgi:hypothetical protein